MKVILLTNGNTDQISTSIQRQLTLLFSGTRVEIITANSDMNSVSDGDLILYIFTTDTIAKPDLDNFKKVCMKSKALGVPLLYVSLSSAANNIINVIESTANVYSSGTSIGFCILDLDALIDILVHNNS